MTFHSIPFHFMGPYQNDLGNCNFMNLYPSKILSRGSRAVDVCTWIRADSAFELPNPSQVALFRCPRVLWPFASDSLSIRDIATTDQPRTSSFSIPALIASNLGTYLYFRQAPNPRFSFLLSLLFINFSTSIR